MSCSFRSTITMLIGATLASVPAAELTYLDLRVGGGVLSNQQYGAKETTFTGNLSSNNTQTVHGEDPKKADSNYRGQIEIVGGSLGRFGGPIVGIDVAVHRETFKNAGGNLTITTPVVDLLIGYGYAVLPSWHFELAPFAGVGRSYYHHDGSHENKGYPYVEYGGRIATYFTVAECLQFGIEVPYLVGRMHANYSHDDGTNVYSVSDKSRNEGFGILGSIGMRF
ncbi:hypothetical protein LBMAG53_02530 [Planctomycetota bacterium]|nr:hypothetical protein LBMAG53_02530 [Planctomycetota bacterium]